MHLGRGNGLGNINSHAGLRDRGKRVGNWLSALGAIGVAAFAVEIPFFFLGTPSGHDVEFHLNSWLEVLSQWKQGILFPRWAAFANFGYGEPRFVFYPAASWLLGAFLGRILPWEIVSCVYIWIALTLAGLSMFLLAQRWFSRRDAIFASVLYAVNPYHLVIVYWRSAFAELLASCLLPILLLLALRIAEGERRVTIPLALVLAAAWLTNAPAAVMIHYSMALLLVVFGWRKRSLRILGIGTAAVLLGAGLAGFYLLPAIYEQKWVDIAQAISSGSRPAENFLFAHTTDIAHDKFNRIISWVAVLEMAALFATGAATKIRGKINRDGWNGLFFWACACSLLMLPITLLAWRILPKLEFMQFPWRWMLCLSMIFALLVTAATADAGRKRWWIRAAIYVLGLGVIVAGWHFIQPPWWDTAGDLRELKDNVSDRIGYEGTDEYAPLAADVASLNKDAPNVGVAGTAHAAVSIEEWGAEKKLFTAEVSAPTKLTLRLFQYPAWKAMLNGREVQTGNGDAGQIVVPVDAGVNHVQITFVRTRDRTLGGWISVITAFCICMGLIFVKKRN